MIWNSKKKKNAEIENAEAVETTKAAEQNEPEQSEQAEPVEKKEKKGFFARLREGMTKTRESITHAIDQLTGVYKELDDDFYDDLEAILIGADVGVRTTEEIISRLKEEVRRRREGNPEAVRGILKEIVAEMMDAPAFDPKSPSVILVVGVNGVGKTTTIAKLAHRARMQGKKVMIAAADTFRAAAIEQLQVWAERVGALFHARPAGSDPASVAYEAMDRALAEKVDILFVDTAGRLQIDEVLMQELVQIKEAVPVDETLLVVDAMAGQDAVNVAKTFNETVGVDGIILTKTDGDTRGGAALSVLAVTGKPIKFQGTGEKLDDLDVFHPDRMASRILGMGDVLSLIERAQDAADEKAAEETAKRLMENKFDMNDMLEQFAQIRKMGGAGAMLSMLPGASGIDASQIDEKAFDRIEAMIYSMTKEEREKPSIINPKRKRRIAAGSGTRVEDVNKLLKQYEMMQKMMKQFKKSPKGFARRLGGMMGNPNAFRGLK